MNYNDIVTLIKSIKNDVDDETLKYFANYFVVAIKKQVIPLEISIDDLIKKAFTFASKIEFYDESHPIYKKLGSDPKGYRDPDTKTIFIRNNLPEPLKEITVYHELHHAIQTDSDTKEVGINQESNIGRLIMEAQTQYFAEEIYQEIYDVQFPEQEIPSEKLRMLSGGIVKSKLHNYEMYDSLLTKLAIVLEVPKDFFVQINYLTKNNQGLKLLAEKYNIAKEKYQLPYDFQQFLAFFDYVYVVDLEAYIDNPAKETILSGQETKDSYEIYPNWGMPLSLNKQKLFLETIDKVCFLSLADHDGNYKDFARYIIDNQIRSIAMEYIQTFENNENDKNID